MTNVQLTPGMIAPILSGMLLGFVPGAATGAIIGIYAAVISGEFWVIPFLGNICLGISSGLITSFLSKSVSTPVKSILYLISAAVIGGFLPTFITIIIFLPDTLFIAALSGMFDFINALLAAVIALIVWIAVINKFPEFLGSDDT